MQMHHILTSPATPSKSMTLLERLHQRRHLLTKREQAIAGYLERGYPHAGLGSAAEVGEGSGTSAATVVRLIAKLGYSGYADFQKQLRGAVEVRLTTPLRRLDERLDANAMSPHDDVVKKTFELAIGSITQTYSLLDRDRLVGIAQLFLRCSGRIIVVGGKRSWTIGSYLRSSLSPLLERVTFLSSDFGFAADELMDISAEDVIVVFDLRRYAEHTAQVADWALERGTTLVVISDSPMSPNYERTLYRLHVEASNIGIFDTLAGCILAIDVLINLVASLAPDRVRQRLKLGEACWKEFGIFWKDQSLPAEPATTPPRQGKRRRGSARRQD